MTIITLIGENNQGQAPSQADLQSWANDNGLTHPVLADGDINGDGYNFDITASYLWGGSPTNGFSGSFGLPNMQLLSSGMVIEHSNAWLQLSNITPYLQ